MEPQGGGAVERHGPESAVHRHGAPPSETAYFRRAVLGLRPHQRRPAQERDPTSARRGSHRDFLHPQHGQRGDPLRQHHPHQPLPQHPLGQRDRNTPANGARTLPPVIRG